MNIKKPSYAQVADNPATYTKLPPGPNLVGKFLSPFSPKKMQKQKDWKKYHEERKAKQKEL